MLSLKNLLMAALLIFALSIVGTAEAGIVTDKMPLQCYVDHKVTSYDLNSGQAVGWIDAEVDLVQIEEIGGNGVARGTHPGRNGTVRRLFWARDVFADTNYANRPAHVEGYHEVYRTSSSGSTIGSVKDEDVTVVADNGNRAQIVYRLNNGTGYKMGWVPSSVVAGNSTNNSTNNYAQPEDGDYYIVPINSTCAIDVPNNWHDEGTVLHIYNKNDSPAQTFRLERVGNGWYKIIHKDSGNVMNVQYGNNGNGTRLWLYHYDGSASCHWRFRDLGDGFYNIESQLPSNPFLEVQNGNPFNGAVLQLWQQHNGDAAKWTLKKASSPTPDKNFPSSIYLTQIGDRTCTLTASAMMLRAKAYLNGINDWASITETSIRSTAWVTNVGLSHDFTYRNMRVRHSSLSGISVSNLKNLLNQHPEGIVLHCKSLPHAVWVISYSGDTFYCSDPLKGYSGDKRLLSNSYLGRRLGNQSSILNNATAYWYIQ